MYLIGFPLLVIPFAIYNMIAFLTPGVSWSDAIATFALPSGVDWSLSAGDVLLALAVLLLAVELVKATRIGTRSVVDHVLSAILFVAMAAEFLMLPQAATSTFFILTAMGLADVIAGIIIGLRSRPPDLAIEPFEHGA
jgi:hypothetical protein